MLAHNESQVLESSNLTSKVTRLVSKLQSRGIDSKAKLSAAWVDERLFLQEELISWFKPAGKTELALKWAYLAKK